MSEYEHRPLITEAFLEAAKRRVNEVGRFESEKQMKRREPHLYSALCRIANDALGDGGEALGDEAQAAAHDAVWRAAVVAIEAYRVAQLHLWADTCLGPQMERLDPGLADRAWGFPERPRGERDGDGGEGRESREAEEGGGDDKGE